MMKLLLKGTKKLVLMLAVFALLASAVACGGGGEQTGGPEATGAVGGDQTDGAGKPVNLKMITWSQQTNLDAIEGLNAAFTEKYPNVTFTIDHVNSNDYPTLMQTRIAAGDVDIISNMYAFDALPQDFTKGCDDPAWLTFIQSGAYLDITDEPFIKNWDPAMIRDAVSYEGRVYGLDMGKVGFNGVFYNKKLFDENGFEEPGTWAELSDICKKLSEKGITPFTAGVKDAWPVNMLASGFVAANETDIAAYTEGLWTGTRKFTDEGSMKIWSRIEEWASYFEKGVAAVDYASAPGRFVAGKAAMMPDGTWNSGAIEALDPDFEFGYFAIPGDAAGNPNQLAGKYDIQFNIYAKTPNTDVCLQWFDFLSQKENYTPFINALSMFPTMQEVEISNEFILSMQDKNTDFALAFERICVQPKGVGQYAAGVFPITQLKAFGGTIETAKELAQLQQKDWDDAIAAAE